MCWKLAWITSRISRLPAGFGGRGGREREGGKNGGGERKKNEGGEGRKKGGGEGEGRRKGGRDRGKRWKEAGMKGERVRDRRMELVTKREKDGVKKGRKGLRMIIRNEEER